MSLESLGWTPSFQQAWQDLNDPALEPARVARQERTQWRVLAASGAWSARLAGRARREPPSVGDWVAGKPDGLGGWTIHARLPRRGALSREAPGEGGGEQVLAANVDVVLVVAALDQPLNARRIERFVALAHAGGARPVVVLAKADACADLDAARRDASAVGAPVVATSARSGLGVDEVRALAGPGVTVALVGPSGAGKSSLANALLGEDALPTGDVRASDKKGRHTTTWRELVPLPGGGVLLDTPGLRELALADGSGLAATFDDVDALATRCRFSDCAHESEPGCAVRDAVEPARLAAWRKLQREALRAAMRKDAALARKENESWRRTWKARHAEAAHNARRKRGHDQ